MDLLVDADIAAFEAAVLNQETYEWDEDTTSTALDLDRAKEQFDSFIVEMMKRTKTDGVLLCFSSEEPCFRYDVLPSYKHNRKNVEKPVLLQELRQHAIKEWPTKIKPKLEADDVIGIMATLYPGKYIMASIDKDLMQIPGKHYDWRKDEQVSMGEVEADNWFYRQALTGDPTDGYSGCPGIGPKRAARILEPFLGEDPWPAIVEAYENKGLTREDALQQARVARILRKSDYDFKKKQVKLWTPPAQGRG